MIKYNHIFELIDFVNEHSEKIIDLRLNLKDSFDTLFNTIIKSIDRGW